MPDIVSPLDAMLAMWFSPLLRAIMWGAFAGALSMAIYARISPQAKITALKTSQKDTRQKLMSHDGEMAELMTLVRSDLGSSLKQIGLAVPAFLVSVIPVAYIVYCLSPHYTEALVSFGAEWMQGFEFWYISVMVVVSLIVKLVFKIA